MERKDEIKQILKHLLSKINDGINNNQYSQDMNKIKKSCESVLKNAEFIKKYMEELVE